MIPFNYMPEGRPVRQEDIVNTARLIFRESGGLARRTFRATGRLAGTTVLVASILLTALSAVAIHSAQPRARQVFLKNHFETNFEPQAMTMRPTTYLLAYGSATTLFLSFIMENIYMFFTIGTRIISTETIGPRIRSKRYLQFLLPSYWIVFVCAEISSIITIRGLHHKAYLAIPFRLALALDILAIVLIIFVHIIAVQIQVCILVRDRINALPELTVETNDYENCVICIDTPSIGEIVRQLPCQHTFHKKCIEKWLIKKPSCAICKRRI